MASIENIRVDIRSILPGNGAELFIYSHGSEVIWVGANRLENRATKKWLQIHDLMYTIRELQSDSEFLKDLD